MGRLAGREDKIKGEPRPRRTRSKQENKERRTLGASHPATQQTTEKEAKKGVQKWRKIKVQRQKVVGII